MSTLAAAPKRASHSVIAEIIERLLLLCAITPYALVALALRLLLARVFFLSGQAQLDGTVIPLAIKTYDLSITLPDHIKDAAMQTFQAQYAGMPWSTTTSAYLFTFAAFVLPIFLVLGFATRFAALGLFVMTVLIQVYVAPGAFWTLHAYWLALLLVLLTCGPGAISVDGIIRYFHEK